MKTSKMVSIVLGDIRNTINELYSKNFVRDYKEPSCCVIKKSTYQISFSEKNKDICNIVYDEHISAEEIMDKLLNGRQYSVLLYDKSLIQAEFIINKDNIVKERLMFMKRHNKIWKNDEINEAENSEQDWFSEENGVPIVLRIDYDPEAHIDGEHSATHLTISNHNSCHVPIKNIVSFSEFVRFVLQHFYNEKMELKQYRFSSEDTISSTERKMIHINWE